MDNFSNVYSTALLWKILHENFSTSYAFLFFFFLTDNLIKETILLVVNEKDTLLPVHEMKIYRLKAYFEN